MNPAQRLEAVWSDVQARLSEDFCLAHPQLVAELESAYEAYAGDLEDVTLREELLAQLQRFQQARLHWGPSPFPLVNLLHNVEPTDAVLEESEQHFRQALRDLLAAGLGEQAGWGLKKAALESLCQALADLRSGAPPDEQIELISAALHSMHRADETVYQETFLQSPTAMPMVNLVINVARLAPEQLARALETAGQAFEALEEDFSRNPGGDLGQTRLAFDLLYNALEDLHDGDEVASCLARLQAAARRLYGCYQAVAEGERAACLRCGHSNGLCERFCSSCQAQLPRLAPQNLSRGFVLEDEPEPAAAHVVRLLEACGQFYDQQLSAEQFRLTIGQARGPLESALEHLRQLRILEGQNNEAAQTFLDEARGELEHELGEWGEGLDLLEQHSQNLDFDSLEQGIALVWRSSQAVVRRYQAIATDAEDLAQLS